MQKSFRPMSSIRNAKYLSIVIRESQDIRPFTEIDIFDKRISGLLDSGASTTSIRDVFKKLIIELEKPYKEIKSFVWTVNRKIQATKRLVKTVMSFRGRDKSIKVFIILSLSCPFFLGYRFLKAFNLSPVGLISKWFDILITEKLDDFYSLNESQKLQLHTVIAIFLSYQGKWLRYNQCTLLRYWHWFGRNL